MLCDELFKKKQCLQRFTNLREKVRNGLKSKKMSMSSRVIIKHKRKDLVVIIKN